MVTILSRILLIVGIAILLVVGLGIAWLCFLALRSRKREQRLSELAPSDRSAHRVQDESLEQALRNPDWTEFESRFGPPPKALVDFFKHIDLVLARDFAFKVPREDRPRYWGIEEFIPPSQAFVSFDAEFLPDGSFVIATDGMGDSYFVQPQKWTGEDGPVLFYDHETDENTETGLLLGELPHTEQVVGPDVSVNWYGKRLSL